MLFLNPENLKGIPIVMTRYYQTYLERNDHEPGYCYLIEAVGFHGWLPGCYLRRVKIGLTRSISRRLEGLALNQPPCDYKVVALVEVDDMLAVENFLHTKFKHCQVKLEKSREYFDLNPIDYAYCLWLFRRMSHVPMWKYINFQQLIARTLIVAGLVVLAVPMIQRQFQPQVESRVKPTPQTRIKQINR